MKTKFQGYQLSELYDHFNLEFEENDVVYDEQKVLNSLKDFLSYHLDVLYSNKDTTSSMEFVQDCREYLEKFIDNLEMINEDFLMDELNLFSSLESIKDEDVFLEYFILLLSKMFIEQEF